MRYPSCGIEIDDQAICRLDGPEGGPIRCFEVSASGRVGRKRVVTAETYLGHGLTLDLLTAHLRERADEFGETLMVTDGVRRLATIRPKPRAIAKSDLKVNVVS